jgi:putative ABC transport system ATP-binding protein
MTVLELRSVSKVYGQDTLRMSAGAKSRLRRRTIGYTFQDFNLLPGLTAPEAG